MLRVYSDQNVIVWQKSYLNFVTKMLHKIYLDCIKQNVWVVMVPRTNRILKTKLQTENSDSFSFFCLFDYYSQFLRSTREIEWWTCRLLMIIYSCFWRSNARARKKKFVIASARGVSFECCVCVSVLLVISLWRALLLFPPFFHSFLSRVICRICIFERVLICVMWWSSSLETLRRPREGHTSDRPDGALSWNPKHNIIHSSL